MTTETQLDPRPIGWFAVACSKELLPGQNKSGILCASDYSIARDLQGNLTFTGCIGDLREQNEFIFAWHHPENSPPTFEIPVLDESGWRPFKHQFLQAKSHPQETFENSIDLAHFPKVHGFSNISVLTPMTLEEHSMFVRYRIERENPNPFSNKKICPRFEVKLHGLGCAHNHIEIDDFGLRLRMMALSTPTSPGQVDIRLAVALNNELAMPFKFLLRPILHHAMMHNVVNDFCQDIEIWENKRYTPPPVLSKVDGPIGHFRKWCRQYYRDNTHSHTHIQPSDSTPAKKDIKSHGIAA